MLSEKFTVRPTYMITQYIYRGCIDYLSLKILLQNFCTDNVIGIYWISEEVTLTGKTRPDFDTK